METNEGGTGTFSSFMLTTSTVPYRLLNQDKLFLESALTSNICALNQLYYKKTN